MTLHSYHRRIRKNGRGLRTLTALLLCAALCLPLCACGETVAEEEPAPEETPTPVVREYRVPWRLRVKTLNEGSEAVLFQQAEPDGFLAIVNRKTGENIPEELTDAEEIPQDGRYDVYENQIIRYRNQGGQESPGAYKLLDPPPYAVGTQSFISENRLMAVRSMEDGRLITIESSYECWLEPNTQPSFHSRDTRMLRVLSEDGEEESAVPIELDSDGEGFDAANLVYIGSGMLAVARRNSVLVFGLDGKEIFHVTTPYPVAELLKTSDGNLAVLLHNGDEQWLSLIQVDARTVSVPFPVPTEAHLFCADEAAGELLFVRNTELFRLQLSDGSASPVCSLLDMGIDPVSIGAMFCGQDGRLHFLVHEWQRDYKSVRELHVTAIPQDTVKEGVELRLGFTEISTAMKEAVLRFNRGQSSARITCVDYRNLGGQMPEDQLPDLMILDGEEAGRLSREGRLAVLAGPEEEEEAVLGETLIPAVRRALSDEEGNLNRIAGVFRLESMACDEETAQTTSLSGIGSLRQAYQALPAGGKLYEPWYTRGRLLRDLLRVHTHMTGELLSESDARYGELDAFAALQPAEYNHGVYAADTDSVEKRIYDGRELMMAAHIGSMLEFKWIDAFFPTGAAFVGWPAGEGMASLLCFEETVAVNAACEPEVREAARGFLRCVVEEEYAEASYGFPASATQMEKLLRDDMAAISWRVDEKGKFVLDKQGEKIERPRSNWYTPEWRQHFEFALTEKQYQKLMDLIDSSV